MEQGLADTEEEAESERDMSDGVLEQSLRGGMLRSLSSFAVTALFEIGTRKIRGRYLSAFATTTLFA